MAADLGLVAHAAERDAHELALHRPRDRLAERRLADAGRADEAQDRPLHVALQLAHRQVLDDALLDLVEVVVILVEDRRASTGSRRSVGGDRPRHVEQPVEVGPDHLVLGRRRAHARQPVDLAHRRPSARARAGLRVLDPLAQLRDLVALAFAELLLDRLQLLAQVVLPLRVGHLLLRLRLDLALQLEQRDLARQQRVRPLRASSSRSCLRAAAASPPASCRAASPAGRRAAAGRRCPATSCRSSPAQPGGERQRLLDQLLDAADVARRPRSSARPAPAAA